MKNVLIFIAGMVTGAGLLFLFFTFMLSSADFDESVTNEEKILFNTEGECISGGPFEIYKVSKSGDAFAYELRDDVDYKSRTGLRVLFLGNEEESYYDGQIIRVPEGQCAKQIGVIKDFVLETTYPIVAIRNK